MIWPILGLHLFIPYPNLEFAQYFYLAFAIAAADSPIVSSQRDVNRSIAQFALRNVLLISGQECINGASIFNDGPTEII